MADHAAKTRMKRLFVRITRSMQGGAWLARGQWRRRYRELLLEALALWTFMGLLGLAMGWMESGWPMIAAVGIVIGGIAFGLTHHSRRRVRWERGLCVNCGYDLRASGKRCPECGKVNHRPAEF